MTTDIFKPTRGGFYAAFILRVLHEESLTTDEIAQQYGLHPDSVTTTAGELAARGLIHCDGRREREGMGPRHRTWSPGAGNGSLMSTRRVRIEVMTFARIYEALQEPLTPYDLMDEVGLHQNYAYKMLRWLMELRLIHIADYRMTCRQIPMYQWGFKKSNKQPVQWKSREGWRLAEERYQQRKAVKAMIQSKPDWLMAA